MCNVRLFNDQLFFEEILLLGIVKCEITFLKSPKE